METKIDTASVHLIKQFIEEILTKEESKQSFLNNFSCITSKQYTKKEELYIGDLLQEKLPTTDDCLRGRIYCFLGALYVFTNYSYKDLTVGLKYIENAVNLKNAVAINIKAYMYMEGLNVIKDVQLSIALYNQAIALNNPDALSNLGYMYYIGLVDGQPNYQKAKELYEQAIVLNYPAAMNNLGDMYYLGLVDGQLNFPKAKELYEQAIVLNYPPAMNNLGHMYYVGFVDRQRNYQKAKELYEQAIVLNYPPAMNNLGDLYYEGFVDGQRNFLKAKELYEQAIVLNCHVAMIKLGNMYKYGIGVIQNLTHTAKLFRKAGVNLDYINNDNPNDPLIRYHWCMTQTPTAKLFQIRCLLKRYDTIIGECILYDELLSDREKYDLFLHDSFKPYLLCESLIPHVESVSNYGILAEYYLLFAQNHEKQRKMYCEKALYYYFEARSTGDNYIELAHKLYYFMAKLYDESNDYHEAIMLCFNIESYIPAQHLLAHLLFTHDYNMPSLHRHLLCLYWLQQKTTLPTTQIHEGLLNLILNIHQEELLPVKDKPKTEQLTWFLKKNHQLLTQSYNILTGWVLIWQLTEITTFYEQMETQYKELLSNLSLIPLESLNLWKDTLQNYMIKKGTKIIEVIDSEDKQSPVLCVNLIQKLNEAIHKRQEFYCRWMLFFRTESSLEIKGLVAESIQKIGFK